MYTSITLRRARDDSATNQRYRRHAFRRRGRGHRQPTPSLLLRVKAHFSTWPLMAVLGFVSRRPVTALAMQSAAPSAFYHRHYFPRRRRAAVRPSAEPPPSPDPTTQRAARALPAATSCSPRPIRPRSALRWWLRVARPSAAFARPTHRGGDVVQPAANSAAVCPPLVASYRADFGRFCQRHADDRLPDRRGPGHAACDATPATSVVAFVGKRRAQALLSSARTHIGQHRRLRVTRRRHEKMRRCGR
jgi:hypothetical protein